MKIAEMNNCIEKMRELYKFDDTKTHVRIERSFERSVDDRVQVFTEDDNGTEITMSRRIDELVEVGGMNE